MFETKYALSLIVSFSFQANFIYTSYLSSFLIPYYVQVVIGTLVIVTLTGSMAIVFYASSIFKVSGKTKSFLHIHILIL